MKAASLTSGRSKSCGCLHREVVAEVGRGRAGLRKRHPKEYAAWNQMLQRCHNPKNHTYPRYGGRGITVCARWRKGFRFFIADMGPKPSPGHTLDRKKSDKGYSPGNCQWLPAGLQARNRLFVKRYDVNGEKLSGPEIAEKFGLPVRTVAWRLRKGWPVDRVISQNPKLYHGRPSAD